VYYAGCNTQKFPSIILKQKSHIFDIPTTYMLKCTLWDFLGFVWSEYDGQIIMGWIYYGRKHQLKVSSGRGISVSSLLCVLRFFARIKRRIQLTGCLAATAAAFGYIFVDYYYFLVQVYLFFLSRNPSKCLFNFWGYLLKQLSTFIVSLQSRFMTNHLFIFTKMFFFFIHAPQPAVN
jgi:hypothetical protein